MPTINFAMPLGHNNITNFPTVTISKTFRQPFNFDGQQASHATGLDLLINDNPVSNFSDLYAFVEGTIEFFAKDATRGDRLVLTPSLNNVQQHLGPLFSRFTLEAPPAQIIYENIDVTRTRNALSTLLTTAGKLSRTGHYQGTQDINAALGTTNPASVLNNILDRIFKVGSAPSPIQPLPVGAGDVIAVAGPAASGKRQFLWSLLDLGHQFLNPFFFLNQFIAGQAAGTYNTHSLTTDLTTAQPIIALTPANVSAREKIATVAGGTLDQIPYSIGPLGEFHRFPMFTPLAAPTPQKPKLERRLIPSSPPPQNFLVAQLEVHDAGTHTLVQITDPHVNQNQALTKITQLWQDPQTSARVNTLCDKIGVPCEFILMVISKESGGSALAWRLEPLQENEREILRNVTSTALVAGYDRTIGIAGTVVNVQRQPPRPRLANVSDESDNRPTTSLRFQLNGTDTRSFSTLVDGTYIVKQGTALTLRRKRHFFFDDQGDGYATLIRSRSLIQVTPPPHQTFDNTICDFVVDDQQLDLDTRAFTLQMNGNVVVPLQKCTATHAAKGQNAHTTAFYLPGDRCASQQDASPTAAVQYTVKRNAILRALYIDVGANLTDAVTVTVVRVSGASQAPLITRTLAAGSRSASETATEKSVSIGDKLTIKIETNNAGLPNGIRVRVHLAPVDGSVAYILDGASHDGTNSTKNPGNPYPATGGLNLAGRVRGTAGNPEHPLTWGDLLTVLEPIQGNCMSPGATQTLISTANENLDVAERVVPNLIQSLLSLGVTARPARDSNRYKRYLYDDSDPAGNPNKLGWLLREPNAVLAATVLMKRKYPATAFDLPAVCAAYNTGSPSPPTTPWEVNVKETYVRPAILYYNAAVQFFDGSTPPSPVPTVRFRP